MKINKLLCNWIRSYWIIIIFSILCIILGIYNFFKNATFFITPLTTIITIFIAVIISFYLTQRKTDNRRKSEKLDKLLYKIQELVNDPDFISPTEKTLLMHRSVANTIKLIEVNIDSSFSEDIAKINANFNSIRDIYGNHYTDHDYMAKSRMDFTNYVNLIDNICDKIHMELG